MQDEREFEWLHGIYCELKPKVVLEIGSYRGGSLWWWIHDAPAGALIVSVDEGAVAPSHRILWCEWVKDKDVQLISIIGDSHKEEIVEHVRKLAGSVDFLFIDADHTEKGCQADWDNYSPMVRTGGIVALHDITRSPANENYGVWKVWERIKKSGLETDEMISFAHQCGTGIVYK